MRSRWTGPAILTPALLATAGLLTAAAPAGALEATTPQVFSATITPSDIRPHSAVTAEVATSPDVTSVVAQVAGRTIPIPRVAAGTFRGETTTPRFPHFIHFRLKVTFVARDAAGTEARFPQVVTVN